jgi:hypothetical protein
MSDVIRSANFSNIESTWQINSRNLNQVIKFTTVLSSPLISLFVGRSLGFDSFEAILKQKTEGEVVNAMEKADFAPLEKYNLVAKATKSISDFVKSATDSAPAFHLVPSTSLTASAADDQLSVTGNGALLCQEGVRLYNPRTKETILVLTTADGNDNIQVQRAANGSTVGTILTTDTLLLTGTALDLFTPQVVASAPIPRRSTILYNGFRRLFSAGTPITNTVDEKSLLYDGRFFDLIDEHLQVRHKGALINSLVYEEYGDISAADKANPGANINKFNGYRYWANQNAVTAGFTDIGAMTSAKFESLMTWFDTYEGIGSSKNSPMVYICGKTAHKALQPFLKAGILVTVEDGFVPSTVGGYVQKYVTETGRVVYICIDDYLGKIGRSGDIIMCAEDNMTLFVGEDEFLTPENPALGTDAMLPGEARFCQLIKNYSVKDNQRFDVMVSQYSMLPTYVELCSMATGITAS